MSASAAATSASHDTSRHTPAFSTGDAPGLSPFDLVNRVSRADSYHVSCDGREHAADAGSNDADAAPTLIDGSADEDLVQERYGHRYTTALYLMQGAVGLVLLVACVSVALLLLGWPAARQRELALRIALGAGRSHVAGRVALESLALAVSVRSAASSPPASCRRRCSTHRPPF